MRHFHKAAADGYALGPAIGGKDNIAGSERGQQRGMVPQDLETAQRTGQFHAVHLATGQRPFRRNNLQGYV